MTTHVEKAIPEPVAEPLTAASPSKPTASSTNDGFAHEMLSPVSKLELARKYAAEEQQRRVEAACERMVDVKKTQTVETVEVTETTTTTTTTVVETARGGRLSSFAMRVVSAFKSTKQDANATGEEETASPTRKLLQATRNKLNALTSKSDGGEDADLPATNYHLKQLGLADEKINIYAPIHEQQSEIRRRRESAIRCQEKYMQENAAYPGDEGYKSGEDSDFAPDADDDEAVDSGSDDDDEEDDDNSEVEIDEDEVRELLADQSEFVQSVASLKKHAKRSKQAAKAKAARKTPLSIAGAILALLLAIVLAIFVAEQQSGFCRALVAEHPRAEEPRIAVCHAVLQVEALFQRLLRAVSFQS